MTSSVEPGRKGTLLAAGLAQVSLELNDLKNQVQRLEETVGQAIPGWKQISREDATSIQQLDLIRQTLGELSFYVSGLQAAVPSEQTVATSDVLARIKLRDLASRLGAPRMKPELPDQPRAEDIELF